MATKTSVTGFTAERMRKVEGQSIVSGRLLVNNLLLKNFAGQEFDLGNIRGPKGDTGAVGPAGSTNTVNGVGGSDPVLKASDFGAESAATLTARGFIEIASMTEAIAGTDNTRAITPAVLANMIDRIMPIGTIMITGAVSDTETSMIANGRSLVRSEYPELYAVCGTKYGAPSSTTFQIPNLKGRTVVGRDANQTEFDTIGEVGGTKTHGHKLSDNAQALVGLSIADKLILMKRVQLDGEYTTNLSSSADTVKSSSVKSGVGVGLTGNTDAASTLSPYAVLNYTIKYK